MDRRFAVLMLSALAFALPSSGRAGAPEPASVVSTADLQKVFGGKWTASSPEPGVLICEETGGSRVVNVYLSPANGKTVAEMVPGYREMGETVDRSGELLGLSVSVHNVDGPEQRKKLAIDLVKLAAAKL